MVWLIVVLKEMYKIAVVHLFQSPGAWLDEVRVMRDLIGCDIKPAMLANPGAQMAVRLHHINALRRADDSFRKCAHGKTAAS